MDGISWLFILIELFCDVFCVSLNEKVVLLHEHWYNGEPHPAVALCARFSSVVAYFVSIKATPQQKIQTQQRHPIANKHIMITVIQVV